MSGTKPKRRWRHLYLRGWRKHRRLTQEELAARIGVTQGMISQLETGQSNYTGDLLEQLAQALQCEPGDLLMRNPLDPEAPWTIWDQLKPAQRKTAIRMLKALAEEEAA